MSLLELAVAIFAFNLMTFGSGTLMVPLLQSYLVEERHALTLEQLLFAFTIARVTPGQANLYVASIGYMMFGLIGAAVTILSIMLPGYLMLPLVGMYERFQSIGSIRHFTRGLTSASVGLIFATTVDIGRRTLTGPIAWLVVALTVGLIYGLKLNPIVALLIACAAGIALNAIV